MKDYPLVSLIIISFNQRKYIEDCMQSIMHLSYPNIEFLYLDDCSPDGTYDVAECYEKKIRERYNCLAFTKNSKNRGLIANLNELIKQCNGKYVKFMAADDFLLEDSIASIVEYMEKHAEYDMVYTNGVYGDSNTHFPFRETDKERTLYQGEQPNGSSIFSQLYEKDFIAAPTVMIRRSVYSRLGVYDDKIGIEDWEYFLRIAQNGSIGYIDTVTVMYRFTDTSLSHSNSPVKRINMQKSGLLIQEKYKTQIQNSAQIINKSFNDAYQDALHIDDSAYFEFLTDYAKRNQTVITGKNRFRYILYKLGIFKLFG